MWQSYHSLELRTYFYYEAKRLNIKVKMLIIVKAYQCVWKEPFASSHAGGPGSGWYLAERKAGESSLIHIHFFLLWSCSVMGSWKQVSWTPLSSHLWTPQMWWSSDFHRAAPEKQKSVYYTREVWMKNIAKKCHNCPCAVWCSYLLKNKLFEQKYCNLTDCKSLYNFIITSPSPWRKLHDQ